MLMKFSVHQVCTCILSSAHRFVLNLGTIIYAVSSLELMLISCSCVPVYMLDLHGLSIGFIWYIACMKIHHTRAQ